MRRAAAGPRATSARSASDGRPPDGRPSHRRLVARIEEPVGVVTELEEAAATAEPVRGAVVLELQVGCGRVDLHPTHGIRLDGRVGGGRLASRAGRRLLIGWRSRISPARREGRGTARYTAEMRAHLPRP